MFRLNIKLKRINYEVKSTDSNKYGSDLGVLTLYLCSFLGEECRAASTGRVGTRLESIGRSIRAFVGRYRRNSRRRTPKSMRYEQNSTK